MLVDLSAATLGAPQSALDIDVAELLVACTVLVGPERALRHGRRGRLGRRGRPRAAVPAARRADAAPPRPRARRTRSASRSCAAAAAEATGQEVPELVPMRRVPPRGTSLLTAADRVRRLPADHASSPRSASARSPTSCATPSVAWVVVALILAQSTFVASGISLRGAVPTPLPLLPCVVLQSAIKFINLTVPELGRPDRDQHPLPAADGRADAAGGRRRRGRRRLGDDRPDRALSCSRSRSSTSRSTRATSRSARPSGRLDHRRRSSRPRARRRGRPRRPDAAREGRSRRSGARSSSLWAVARDRRKRLELFGGNIALGAPLRPRARRGLPRLRRRPQPRPARSSSTPRRPRSRA